MAEVSDTGDVTAEGHHLGRIDGFRFIPDESADAEERRRLRSASLGALQGWFAHRADKFYNAPDTEIDVTEQGGLMWGEVAVGRLEPGADALTPGVRAFVDDMLEPPVVEKIERRLGHWINRRVAALFEPMIAMRDDEALVGMAKGLAHQLVEGLGVLDRRPIAQDVKGLDQDGRALLRKHGVRFGQHSVFMPLLLKPAPTRLRLVLWGLAEKLDEIPGAPPAGHVTVPAEGEQPDGFWLRAGYRKAGARAIRLDMLERLADLLRDKDSRGGFEATADMLSITGLTLEQFADLMGGLGFEAAKGERPKAPKPETPAQAAEAPAETPPEAAGAETPVEPEAPAEGVAAEPAAPVEDIAATPTEEAAAEPETPSKAPDTPAEDAATAPEAEATAPAEPTEGEDAPEIEVFYTFTYVPRRQHRGLRREGGRGEGGRGEGGRGDGQRNDGPRKEGRRDGPPRGPKKQGKRPPKGPREDKPRKFSAGPKEKPMDPDSPFAVLQRLKEGK